MAEPPGKTDPSKPAEPGEAKVQSLSEHLAAEFEPAAGANLRSVDAEGRIERGANPSAPRGSSSVTSLIDELPASSDEGRLELQERAPLPRSAGREVPPPRAASPLGEGRTTRKALLVGSGVGLSLLVLLLAVGSRRWKSQPVEVASDSPMKVDSEPAGAEILVDGHDTGQKTPATLGSWDWIMPHEISLTLPGRATYRHIVPEGLHPAPMKAVLAPVAFLDVQSVPPGAEIRRDDFHIGTTPGHFELMAGERNTVILLLPHYLPATLDLTAAPEELVSRVVTLTPAGTLNLDSDPSGVKVEIDGRPAGETPLQIDLEAGHPHTVRLTSPGLNAEEKKVMVAHGKVASLTVLLGDKMDRELRGALAATDRRLRSAQDQVRRLDNPRQSREFFQTMARNKKRTQLEAEIDALEAKQERLQAAIDSHRSVLEDQLEHKEPRPPTHAEPSK